MKKRFSGAIPSPLYSGPLNPGDPAHIAGYGITGVGLSNSGLLRQAVTKVSFLAGTGRAGSTEFMLSSGDGVDTCRFDSGGPVFVMGAGGLALVGVTSWGEGCGVEGHYSDARLFADWIAETSAKLRAR